MESPLVYKGGMEKWSDGVLEDWSVGVMEP
jgi:hypothetical protein